MARICLITAHHVSFQPRTLREADSLAEAGHSVRVVSRQVDPELSSYDREIIASRQWRSQTVDISRADSTKVAWFIEGATAKLCRRLFDAGIKTEKIAVRSYLRGYRRLLSMALAEPADWFIAHTQPALPVAAEASKYFNARLGFDCEDLLAENGTDPADVVQLIQQRYLSECDYVSVPSRSMGARLQDQYKLELPSVLYNVMPLYLAKKLVDPSHRVNDEVVHLHWFGQTIGSGRGVEEAIEALGLLAKHNVELHLRGRITPEYRNRIQTLAERHGVGNRVTILPLVSPSKLVEEMGKFHVGLALERSDHRNYSLTVTNKIFSYLLGGLAVAATDTPGQRELLNQISGNGFLFPAGDARALAEGLRIWIEDRASLLRAQQSSWDAARSRFCWDVEKEKLLALVNSNSN